MKILTWNIQSTKGCDGVFNPERIVKVIEAFGHLDVICLQEVARYIPAYDNRDQKTLLKQHFKNFESVWATGFSTQQPDGKRSEFGNLTLVRRPLLLDARVHFLPWPAHEMPKIPRVAIETTILDGNRPVSVLNTHLAFHSVSEREDQMRTLSSIRDQILAHQETTDDKNQTGAYQQLPLSQSVILCGDLNIDLESDEYQQQIISNGWLDCCNLQKMTEQPANRSPTSGCYDHISWPQGPHVRDYFLISKDRDSGDKPAITMSIVVDTDTDASDHQPLSLEWRT